MSEVSTPAEVMAKAAANRTGNHWHYYTERMRADAIEDMRTGILALVDQFQDPVVKNALLWAASEGETKLSEAKDD
jgi:hypothetical protein